MTVYCDWQHYNCFNPSINYFQCTSMYNYVIPPSRKMQCSGVLLHASEAGMKHWKWRKQEANKNVSQYMTLSFNLPVWEPIVGIMSPFSSLCLNFKDVRVCWACDLLRSRTVCLQWNKIHTLNNHYHCLGLEIKFEEN